MTSATTGAARMHTIGSAIAMARMRILPARGSVTSGDDSSTTGSSVMVEIVQIGITSSRAMTAAASGNTSGNAKAMTTVRRDGSAGHSVSAIAVRDGRATASAISTGIATYPAALAM